MVCDGVGLLLVGAVVEVLDSDGSELVAVLGLSSWVDCWIVVEPPSSSEDLVNPAEVEGPRGSRSLCVRMLAL